MEGPERDSTQDWLLPGRSAPPSLAELEGRIDEALATARASEAAVMTVGAAALDAAEQARRAAKLAERAATSAASVQLRVAPSPASGAPGSTGVEPSDASLRNFSERADRIMMRLRKIELLSQPAPPQLGGDRRSDLSPGVELDSVDRADRLHPPHRSG